MDFDTAIALFWLKKLISVLILPPLMPFALILIGLLMGRRRPRSGRMLVWTGLVSGLLLITPAPVGLLLEPLEPRQPLSLSAATDAQAIVILGGGRMSNAPEYGGDTVNRITLERLRYGARLSRQTGLPILVSGGAPSGEIPEAILMKSSLEEDFDVRVRWTEPSSLDTRQNARYSAGQLKASGVTRIVLVTHAAHMRRARAEFEAAGMQVSIAPTAWLGPRPIGKPVDDEVLPNLPSAGSAYAAWFAVHEWVGLLAYRLSR
ncbi:hypothetical protein CEW83_12580 [Parazoarcus communis]|uniref:DUF218 domain-containing protein n=1 Tax=Parazoarcus communis TaxID=41977 RepID=A0A2U8GR32_9RHOO|nr:YdcF family protein [Parazoarcus communis]AWI75950.1 hypothetical protein CEW83_12580 [Parazoarcus communis]